MFAGPQFVCVPGNRPFGLFLEAHRMLPYKQALQLKCENALSMQIGIWAANGQSAATWRLGCKMAFEFVRKQAIPTFRRRTSYAHLTTGSAEFAGLQSLCVPANRPYGLFGHGHRMFPRQQALRCSRGRKSISSLQTGHSVFSGKGIACFPDNRPCGVCGAAIRLRPC